MWMALLPLLSKVALYFFELFLKKEADKSELRKKIEAKLRTIESRTVDSADARRQYQSNLDELNRPEVITPVVEKPL